MMETWHWGLVGAGLALFFSIVGYLYYRSRGRHSQQKQQHTDYHQGPTIIIDGDDKTPPPYLVVEADISSIYLHGSRSATPNTLSHPCFMTPLSAPPSQFFRDQMQSRWIPATTKSTPPSSSDSDNINKTQGTDWTDNNHRFLSLSPFLGHTHSSPSPSAVSTCSGQTRTPSPALAKLASSWSTWKKHT